MTTLPHRASSLPHRAHLLVRCDCVSPSHYLEAFDGAQGVDHEQWEIIRLKMENSSLRAELRRHREELARLEAVVKAIL